jgi:preprotein translocase subunit YajC
MAQLQQFLPIILIIAVFYLLIIRPQQKRSAAQRQMLSAIKSGDEIVTIGGIYGVIVDVGERVRVRVADGSELELSKQAIAQIVPAKDEPADDDALDTQDEQDTSDEGGTSSEAPVAAEKDAAVDEGSTTDME